MAPCLWQKNVLNVLFLTFAPKQSGFWKERFAYDLGIPGVVSPKLIRFGFLQCRHHLPVVTVDLGVITIGDWPSQPGSTHGINAVNSFTR